MNKSELKPAVVFEQFAKINQIPRPSKREEMGWIPKSMRWAM